MALLPPAAPHGNRRHRSGVSYLLRLAPEKALPFPEGWLLCLSVAKCFLALNAIFLAAYTRGTGQLHRFLVPHYVIACFGIAAGAVSGIMQGIALLGILTFLCMAQIFFSLQEMPSSNRDWAGENIRKEMIYGSQQAYRTAK